MTAGLPHLLVAPIVLPLLAAALLLLLERRRARWRALINVAATFASLLVALVILRRVHGDGAPGAVKVYLAANWEAPFGIVLVADRLSALMLVLTGVVAVGAALYAAAGWARVGVYFHPLFQIQLMGLCGAFLTGDLFNLFVFFEVMLAASYGLQLHGSGLARVRSGLHYIAVNLVASAFFLIGLAMLYGVTGTLSMADVAAKVAVVPAEDRGLLHAGAAIMAVAFLTKAAIWPLGAWLVPAYSAASAPVAALFALMTKVGFYALLRVSTLLFPSGAAATALLGSSVLLYGGLATCGFGILGLMGSLSLGRIAGFSLMVSSGTLVAAIGLGDVTVLSSALFYLVTATLSASALFLLVELVERLGSNSDRARLPDVEPEPGEDTNLDDDEVPLVGRALPLSLALLGLSFGATAVLVAGVPPLSGFVAKLALASALVGPVAPGWSHAPEPAAWVLFALLLLSSLVTLVAMMRAGIRHFWTRANRRPPAIRVVEGLPVLGLIAVCVWLTVRAEPVLRYTRDAAAAVFQPTAYVEAVLSAKPVPGPTRPASSEEKP